VTVPIKDIGIELGVGPEIPFKTHPCICVKRHCPTPVICELHHIFPKQYQNRIWGAVLDNRTQALCSNAHENVHSAIEAMLASKPILRSVNKYQRSVAALGVQRITDAQNGGPKP
jgi:hypothetical protein